MDDHSQIVQRGAGLEYVLDQLCGYDGIEFDTGFDQASQFSIAFDGDEGADLFSGEAFDGRDDRLDRFGRALDPTLQPAALTEPNKHAPQFRLESY